MKVNTLFLCVVIGSLIVQAQVPSEVTLLGLFAQTGAFGSPDQFEWLSAARVAVENVNADPDILPNTQILLDYSDTQTLEIVGVGNYLEQVNNSGPRIGVIGASSSKVCAAVSFVTSWYELPMVSFSCTSPSLSDKTNHPYFLRGVPPDTAQGRALADLLEYFEFDGLDIAAISTADEYGARGIEAFRNAAVAKGMNVVRVEQFVTGTLDVSSQVQSLKDSESRVFVSFMLASDYYSVVKEAIAQEIVGDRYVWFCADGCATSDSFYSVTDGEREYDQEVYDAMVGSFGTTPAGGRGPQYEALLVQWEQLDPEEYPGAGKSFMHPFAAVSYDIIFAYAYAIESLIDENIEINGNTLLTSLNQTEFEGVTGLFKFDVFGDRIPEYDILNLSGDSQQFATVGLWNEEEIEVEDDILVWPDGTNIPPDLEPRDPRDYWSCHDKKEYHDPTGREVVLEAPDEDDIDNIAIDYHCDQYIDCQNMSDEGYDCSGSIIPAMITFGIITGLLFFVFVFLAILIIVLRLLKIERIVHSGPMYILTITFAGMVGILALYSFYGKPTKVSCGFQPWLLGPPIMLLISTLFVRAVTQFIALRSQYGVLKFTGIKFFGCITILMTPFILIMVIWYIVSTPTANYERDIDGEDNHYICISGGLVPHLTWVFFFILVGYGGIVLVLSAIFVFVTRSVKTKYNEAQTIALSIYNLVFVGIVSVPVLFVLQLQHSILAYWILLNVIILYTFTSTIFFHYAPLFVGAIKDALFPSEDEHDKNVKTRPDAEG